MDTRASVPTRGRSRHPLLPQIERRKWIYRYSATTSIVPTMFALSRQPWAEWVGPRLDLPMCARLSADSVGVWVWAARRAPVHRGTSCRHWLKEPAMAQPDLASSDLPVFPFEGMTGLDTFGL